MVAATDYSRIVDERTNCGCINSTFDIFFFLPNLCHLLHLFIIKKSIKNHKIYFNKKILVFLCELRNHFISYHFLRDIGLLFSVNDEKSVYKKLINYSLWFGLFL
jgi:hypothetical protein